MIPPADNRQAAEAAGAATLAELARRLAAHYGDALRVIRDAGTGGPTGRFQLPGPPGGGPLVVIARVRQWGDTATVRAWVEGPHPAHVSPFVRQRVDGTIPHDALLAAAVAEFDRQARELDEAACRAAARDATAAALGRAGLDVTPAGEVSLPFGSGAVTPDGHVAVTVLIRGDPDRVAHLTAAVRTALADAPAAEADSPPAA